MADISKMVADRASISRTVLSSLAVHGSEIAPALTAVLFPNGAPKSLSVAAFLEALHGALARSVEDMMAADIAHAQELSDDDAPRAARDAAIADVREQLIGLRGALSAVYGTAILKTYGLAGETPDDPDLLRHRAENVANQLISRPITETPKHAGISFHPKPLGVALQASTAKLKTALGDISREEREAQITRKRREETLATWSAHYQGIADTATGLLELAGRGDLAELVRPTARRRAGLADEGDVVEGTAGEPSGAPEGGAEAPAKPE